MPETTANEASDYVRKDVFDARMDRGEAIVADMRAEFEKFRSEFKREIGKLRSEVRLSVERAEQNAAMLASRLDSLQTSVYWGFTVLALIVVLGTFSPAVTALLKNLRRASVTLEDVQRIVDAAIERALKPSPHQ